MDRQRCAAGEWRAAWCGPLGLSRRVWRELAAIFFADLPQQLGRGRGSPAWLEVSDLSPAACMLETNQIKSEHPTGTSVQFQRCHSNLQHLKPRPLCQCAVYLFLAVQYHVQHTGTVSHFLKSPSTTPSQGIQRPGAENATPFPRHFYVYAKNDQSTRLGTNMGKVRERKFLTAGLTTQRTVHHSLVSASAALQQQVQVSGFSTGLG